MSMMFSAFHVWAWAAPGAVSCSRPTGSDRRGRDPDRVCMVIEVGPNVKRVVETELRPAIFVVSDEQHRLADNRDDCILVFLRQTIEEPNWDRCQHDRVARLWLFF